MKSKYTFGEKCADKVAELGGSWSFLIAQTIFIVLWITVNVAHFFFHFDPYPFILLNLAFSVQAAYSAPIILMAANRQAKLDRRRDDDDYRLDKDTNKRIKHIEEMLTEKMNK